MPCAQRNDALWKRKHPAILALGVATLGPQQPMEKSRFESQEIWVK